MSTRSFFRNTALAGALAGHAFTFVPPAQSQTLGRLLACQEIARAEERLQCYDSAARSVIGIGTQPVSSQVQSSAPEAVLKDLAQREAAIAEREAALKAREQTLAQGGTHSAKSEDVTLFGITLSSSKTDRTLVENLPNQQIERDDDGAVAAISTNVREWSYGADGMLTFVLENGQVWRQHGGDRIALRDNPEKSHIVRISRGAMGGYNMTLNDLNKTHRVRRVDGANAKKR